VLACLITFNSIRLHYKHSKQPLIRNYTIRILLMIPVYGIEAWFAMFIPKYGVMFKVLREGYEAFVIVSFMQLMLTYLGGPLALARDLAAKRTVTKHLPPLCCVRPWKGAQFVRLTLIGTLQYVPASIFVMALSLSTWFAGVYHEGKVSYNTSWVYCAVVTNCSQMWALYCLVLFYQGTKEQLRPINPLPKFMCVKLIIFFTWWQGIMINLITYYKWVRLSSDPEQEERYESQLQNFIICIEMLILAVCHSYAFPCQEFSIGGNPRSTTAVLADQWDTNLPQNAFGSDESYVAKQCTYTGRNSPRSGITALPVRMVKNVGRSINHRVERLQRIGSGVMASTGEVMSGVNLFDIWVVLQQTKELDAMAAQDAEQTEMQTNLESGLVAKTDRNSGLGTADTAMVKVVHDVQGGMLVKTSPLHDNSTSAGDNKEDNKENNKENTLENQERKSSDSSKKTRAGEDRSPLQPQNKKQLAAVWDAI